MESAASPTPNADRNDAISDRSRRDYQLKFVVDSPQDYDELQRDCRGAQGRCQRCLGDATRKHDRSHGHRDRLVEALVRQPRFHVLRSRADSLVRKPPRDVVLTSVRWTDDAWTVGCFRTIERWTGYVIRWTRYVEVGFDDPVTLHRNDHSFTHSMLVHVDYL